MVKEIREEYFRKHSLNFSTENTCDLLQVFQCMIMATDLLGSSIYETRETWVGLDELHQANIHAKDFTQRPKIPLSCTSNRIPKSNGFVGHT